MQSAIQVTVESKPNASSSSAAVWTGRVLRTLVVLLLVFDGVTKVIKEPHVIAASTELGYSISSVVGVGATLLVCTLLYAIPRTSVLGALLLTAYLGGAVDANVRAGHPAFECIFPAIFGVLAWAGLVLRDPRLGEVLLLRRRK